MKKIDTPGTSNEPIHVILIFICNDPDLDLDLVLDKKLNDTQYCELMGMLRTAYELFIVRHE